MGESSGGALALLLAARHPKIRCVVAYAPVGDLRLARSGPIGDEVRNWLLPFGGYRRWDPLTNARKVRQDVLLVHHVADRTVPVLHSRRLIRRLAKAVLIELPLTASGTRTTHGERTPATTARKAFERAVRLVRSRTSGT